MAKSLEAQLAEVEAEIAKIEAETKRYVASKEYKEKFSVLQARLKTAEAEEKEADATEERIRGEVLCAARIQGNPNDQRSLHPDLVAAIEKLTGRKPKDWKSLAQPGRTRGAEADPVAALVTKLRQEALRKSPEWKKAKAIAEKTYSTTRDVAFAIWTFERETPDKDLWRQKEIARDLQDKIQAKIDRVKKNGTSDDKKTKAETIATRNKVLAIVEGKETFSW